MVFIHALNFTVVAAAAYKDSNTIRSSPRQGLV